MSSIISANFGAAIPFTITLASLANSSGGVGRQSTLIDNTSNRYQKIHIYWEIATGSSGQTGGDGIYFYLIKADTVISPDTITDGGGSLDAGITIVSAKQIDGAVVTGTNSQIYQGDCIINNPGPCWGIAVVNGSGAALASSGSGIWWVGENSIAN